jgi:nucleoside-diphosphate-sugar epimerase
VHQDPAARPVLVTGAAGYVGAVVVARLLAAGRTVRAFDSLLFGDAALAAPRASANGSFALVAGDVRDAGAVREAVAGCDSVIHLARLVGDPACALDPAFTRAINVDGTAHLADACAEAGVRRRVFASTCSVYGAAGEGWLDEDAATAPVSLYAETHLEAEALLRTRLAGSATDACILRFATVFGLAPRMRFDLVVNLLTARALRERGIEVHGGEQWRPQVHVEDVARATILAVDHPQAGGGTFNVGSDHLNLRVADLAERIAARFPGTRLTVSPTRDPRSYRVSFARIERELGFTAERSLEDGVREIAAWLHLSPAVDYRSARFSNVLALEEARRA